MRVPRAVRVVLTAIKAWRQDDVSRMGAALAYYTLFAIGPVVLLAITVAGWFFGHEAARGEIVSQIQGLVGPEGARAVEAALAGAAPDRGGLIASIAGLVTFVVAATGAFMELQSSLNTIWRVKPKPAEKRKALAAITTFLWKRIRSFGLVVSIGFILTVSLVVSAGLSAVDAWLGRRFPAAPILLQAMNIIVSVGVITLLFAMVYRILPDVRLRWRDVWTGALITAGLFTVGKSLIGLYLGRSATASTFGAAGSIVILMIWVYYSSQIILLGAEITRVYVKLNRSNPAPESHAEKTTPLRRPRAVRESATAR